MALPVWCLSLALPLFLEGPLLPQVTQDHPSPEVLIRKPADWVLGTQVQGRLSCPQDPSLAVGELPEGPDQFCHLPGITKY